MLWKNRRESDNIEDQRYSSASRPGLKLSGGTIVLVLLASLVLGENPLTLLAMISQSNLTGSTTTAPASPQQKQAQNEQARFVSVVLATTEDTWNSLLPGVGAQYQQPKLVLFTDQVNSACGYNSAASGPFYCPGDQKVYIDLGFFKELSNLGAPGDFAQAYVVGHEIGHHVQNLLGISDKVHRARNSMSEAQANALSVLLELQADCFAGVWAHHANQRQPLLEPGDIEEGLQAAAAIGDDRLLHNAGRQVSPESFTHGSSQQRVYWLKRGLERGSIADCNTFSKA